MKVMLEQVVQRLRLNLTFSYFDSCDLSLVSLNHDVEDSKEIITKEEIDRKNNYTNVDNRYWRKSF